MNALATSAQPATTPEPDHSLDQVKEMLSACIQCGTCTASCPNAFAMDHTPRHLWRLVLDGQPDDIFHSKTFSLCSSCYYCTLRCPRGLKLTEAMAALKQIAARKKLPKFKKSDLFYQQFLASVRRNGRVREMEFMSLYFVTLKNPLAPFSYASLGLKLMRKGKVAVQVPSLGKGRLDPIFKKVQELEAEK